MSLFRVFTLLLFLPAGRAAHLQDVVVVVDIVVVELCVELCVDVDGHLLYTYFQPAGQPTSKNSALVTDFETTSGIVSKTFIQPFCEQNCEQNCYSTLL